MRKDRDAYLDAIDLRELDRLVSNELNALEAERPEEKPDRNRLWGGALYLEDYDVKSGKKSVPVSGIQERLDRMEHDLQKGLGESQSPGAEDQDARSRFEGKGQAASKDSAESIDEEEERFISLVVEWLRPRRKRNAILSRISSCLAGLEPEAFSSPESEEPIGQAEEADLLERKSRPGAETAKPN